MKANRNKNNTNPNPGWNLRDQSYLDRYDNAQAEQESRLCGKLNMTRIKSLHLVIELAPTATFPSAV